MKLTKINSSNFTWDKWRAGRLQDLGIACRFLDITSPRGRKLLRTIAVGYTFGYFLPCRPKHHEIALMCFTEKQGYSWFHMRKNEFYAVFNT